MWKQQLDRTYQELITLGCDRRLAPGPSGLNRYGASPLPRGAFSLGSCSCSTPSPRATSAAHETLYELRAASDPEQYASKLVDDIRARLCVHLNLSSDVDLAIAPSGTDIEFLVLAIAAHQHDRKLVNIVVGPGEVGSGTLHAAAGCHFDSRLPSGRLSTKGQPVNQELADRISIVSIPVRDRSGNPVSPIELDASVLEAVVDAVESGAHAIVHLVAHSKTGIHAPSLQTTEQISRTMSDDVTIVVDAAQGRLAPSAYQSAIDRGWLVSFTGTKFFGGPPFAAVLMIPKEKELRTLKLPPGFENYFGRLDLPESWVNARRNLDDWCNVPSLLRWQAALTEVESYLAIDHDIRQRIAASFDKSIRLALSDKPTLTLLHDPDPQIEQQFSGIEPSATVFSVELRDEDGQPRMVESLKAIHQHLNLGTGAETPQPCFHVGQPVKISDDRAVLRFALGAPLVIDLATDRSLGSSLLQRLVWLDEQIQLLANRCHQLTSDQLVIQEY